MNEKFEILASTIVDYSIKVKTAENVLLTVEKNVDNELIKQIIDKILSKNASVVVKIIDNEINAFLNSKLTDSQILLNRKKLEHEVNTYDSFININYYTNDYNNKNINNKLLNKYHDINKK